MRLNKVDDGFKTLKDFTLKENDNTHKELDSCKHVQWEIKEIITSLKCRHMKALRTTATTKVEMENSQRKNEGWESSIPIGDMEAKLEAPKQAMIKGIC